MDHVTYGLFLLHGGFIVWRLLSVGVKSDSAAAGHILISQQYCTEFSIYSKASTEPASTEGLTSCFCYLFFDEKNLPVVILLNFYYDKD